MEDPPLPTDAPAIRTIAMPADTNPSGDIFGGWLMSQMDLAASTVATRESRGRAATIAVEGMKFHRPVKVGDEVSIFATLVSTGRTSMLIHVEAWRRRRDSDRSEMVTEANFTFVALDGDGRPRPIRP
jgi:acyl-CoA thioesterase YciA